MLIARLVRRNLVTVPDVEMVNDDVELGKEYEVLGYHSDCVLVNQDNQTMIIVDCYYVQDEFGKVGMLPAGLLEISHAEEDG